MPDQGREAVERTDVAGSGDPAPMQWERNETFVMWSNDEAVRAGTAARILSGPGRHSP